MSLDPQLLSIVQLAEKIAGHFEGCSLKEYICPAGKPTIGHGRVIAHGAFPNGITQAQADAMYREDMARFAKRVLAIVKVPLKTNQWAALVSFEYNCGSLATSTLLKKLNKGDLKGAAAEFDRWVNGGGKKLPGLVRRRKCERFIFEGGTLTDVAAKNWFQ